MKMSTDTRPRDPQRIPYQYWSDRLCKARAMGLNTVFSYVFWDQIQPTGPDSWDMTGRNDITEYFRLAQSHGLNIVLRAGPYVCGEHEWGGFPAWLANVPDMVVRSNNSQFLAYSKKYIDRLAAELQPMMVTNGGPILMVQIENEYGSYGTETTYMEALRDMFSVFGVTLYTNDGGYEEDVINGQVYGVLAEVDGNSVEQMFEARDAYADPSSLGPLLDGEYYITWLDLWASNQTYDTDVGNAAAIAQIQSDLNWTLANGHSISLYMFHGGTNFGFQAGADWSTVLTPVITSYDYGAPLDESGRTTDVYFAVRDTLSTLVENGSIPTPPEDTDPITIPPITLSPSVDLFSVLPDPVLSTYPVNMEALSQSHGFVLYRHIITIPLNGTLSVGDYPRDRILVYVNSLRVGVIDAIYAYPQILSLALNEGDVLDLLVENAGRINYGPRIPDQRKGIVGNVTISSTILSSFEIYSLPLATPPNSPTQLSLSNTTLSTSGPVFYTGLFDVDIVGDTFLSLAGWTKGMVWVNGENLGRYWIVGPQQTLYLPGCYLRETGNEITVLTLEPSETQGDVEGITTRNWGNHPDPDLP
jgi:hypothetical protein